MELSDRYFRGRLRCEDSCLFGLTEHDVHTKIGCIHPTLSQDVFGHQTEGWITLVESMGSRTPVVHRTIGQSVGYGKTVTHPFQLLWCSIYFDDNTGFYRPRFLTKEAIVEILQ